MRRALAVGMAVVMLSGVAAAKGGPTEWQLRFERPGSTLCKGRLVLEKDGREWKGTLQFQTVLWAREHRLTAVSVRGAKVMFTLEAGKYELVFSGNRKGDRMSGRVSWTEVGTFDWDAVPVSEDPPGPVDDGLEFDRDLPRGDAGELGIGKEALDRLMSEAEAAHTDALVVVKDGRVACERYYGGRPSQVHLMSVTKFVTAIAVAMLIEDGKIPSLDAPLSTWFPEWKDGLREKVTLRHVLSHTSGIRHAQSAAQLNEQKDKVRNVRASPVDREPGTEFSYNNDAIALLSGIITAAAGKPADAYLAKRLFEPLGIEEWTWNRDAAGNTITYAELKMRARDLAKIGLLVARGGKWGKKQVLPQEWIGRLGTPATKLKPDCGLIWWVRKSPVTGEVAYYHTGWLGQWLVVYPESGLVAVRLREFDMSEDPKRELGSFFKLLDGLLAR